MSMVKRTSNLELYRCILMLLIVSSHWGVQTNLVEIAHEHQLTANSNFYYLINMWGKSSINGFLMITGYFMCTSKITLRKFLRLYLQVIFYSVSIHLAFCFWGDQSFSVKEWILLLFPFREIESDNFVHAFMVWWLFIPFLNRLIENLSKSEHFNVVVLCLIVFTVLPMLPHSIYRININPICWYSVVYLIAAFVRKYPHSIINSTSCSFWGGVSLTCIVIDICSVFSIIILSHHMGRFITPYKLMVDSNAPMAIATAFSSFMFFKNLKMPHCKMVNAVGATTFGILLIHSNCDAMRFWLWREVFDCVGQYDMPHYWCYALCGMLMVYCSCSLIDYLRINTIEKWTMNRIDRSLIKNENRKK